ncbi:MAG: hypothetical protein AB7S36_22345 [Planctomycetota bacterium]
MLTVDKTDNAPQFDPARPFNRLVEMFYLGAGGLLSVRHGWALQLAGTDDAGRPRFLTMEAADNEVAPDCHVPMRRAFSPDTTDREVELAFVAALGIGLMAQAYDSVFGENADPPESLRGHPAIEVFRHVRNACAHGNRFHFRGDEPRRGGQWGPVSLDSPADQRGPAHPLHGQRCIGGELGPADCLWLLQAVEQLLVAAAT